MRDGAGRHPGLDLHDGSAERGSGGAPRPLHDARVLLYVLQLGTLGFGGPIALAGYMQRDLVEERRWISKQDYLEGLALAQLMPGPLAAQLAMYLGWVRAGVLGATLVAFCFVFPSWLMVVGLSLLYVRYGGLAWMQGAFSPMCTSGTTAFPGCKASSTASARRSSRSSRGAR